MGAELTTCISTTKSASHALLPAEQVMLGDLEDLEKGALECDLLITHAHGRQASERLGKPLLRIGFPVFDRIGNAHKRMVGYRGTMDFIFEFANTMLANLGHHHANDWPLTPEALCAATTHSTLLNSVAAAQSACAPSGCGSCSPSNPTHLAEASA
jgi:nitrogenase molybdenum-iron protein NifN